MILLGNKIDKKNEEKISKDDVEKFAGKKEIQFLKVSCKDGRNVESALELIKKIKEDKENPNLVRKKNKTRKVKNNHMVAFYN